MSNWGKIAKRVLEENMGAWKALATEDGDIDNGISDERLKEIIKTFETSEVIDGLDSETYTIATELLTARHKVYELTKELEYNEGGYKKQNELMGKLIEDGERLADLSKLLIGSIEEFYEQNEVENPAYQAANEVCLMGHEKTLDQHNALMKEIDYSKVGDTK